MNQTKSIKHLNNTTSVPSDINIDTVESWTDTVIWPPEITATTNPQQILEQAKHPTEMDSVHKQATGKGINIAIIDQRLYLNHPEYKDRIKHYEMVGSWPSGTPDYHGSLVTGCAVGKTTGTAPDANIYYFAANNWQPTGKFESAITKLFGELKPGHRVYFNIALEHILQINKTLPENNKIRFLSCSWGSRNDQFRTESDKLFEECEKNGIMVLGGFYKPHRNKSTSCNKSGKKHLMNNQDNTEKFKDFVGIPTDCKTTPYYQGGYMYTKFGGESSTYPFLAGVFACACQNNNIFFTRANWQDELFQIMQETANKNDTGQKIINPLGIRERVTQIAREMETNLTKRENRYE